MARGCGLKLLGERQLHKLCSKGQKEQPRRRSKTRCSGICLHTYICARDFTGKGNPGPLHMGSHSLIGFFFKRRPSFLSCIREIIKPSCFPLALLGYYFKHFTWILLIMRRVRNSLPRPQQGKSSTTDCGCPDSRMHCLHVFKCVIAAPKG